MHRTRIHDERSRREEATSCCAPPPPRRRQAAADVALLRCRHRRSIRAAAFALPPSHCAPPQRFAPSPPPLALPLPLPPLSFRRRRATADVAPLPRRRHAAADVTLSRCRHHHSLHAAATALPPSRCVPPSRFALPPPPPRPRQANHGVSHLHLPSEMLGPKDIYFPPFGVVGTLYVRRYGGNPM